MCVSPGPVKLSCILLRSMIAPYFISVCNPSRAGNELSSTVGVVKVAGIVLSSIVLSAIGSVQSCVQTWESFSNTRNAQGSWAHLLTGLLSVTDCKLCGPF